MASWAPFHRDIPLAITSSRRPASLCTWWQLAVAAAEHKMPSVTMWPHARLQACSMHAMTLGGCRCPCALIPRPVAQHVLVPHINVIPSRYDDGGAARRQTTQNLTRFQAIGVGHVRATWRQADPPRSPRARMQQGRCSKRAELSTAWDPPRCRARVPFAAGPASGQRGGTASGTSAHTGRANAAATKVCWTSGKGARTAQGPGSCPLVCPSSYLRPVVIHSTPEAGPQSAGFCCNYRGNRCHSIS